MQLKRIYDRDAPPEKWTAVTEPCETCKGKGKVVNATATGVEDCPDCEDGNRTRLVPPVAGVEILRAGSRQNFSTRLVQGGQDEGWLSIGRGKLVITGTNKTLTYTILRSPGRYDDGQINHYECELTEEVQANG